MYFYFKDFVDGQIFRNIGRNKTLERDRQTETETQRETERERQRQTDDRQRQTDRQTDRQRQTLRDRERNADQEGGVRETQFINAPSRAHKEEDKLWLRGKQSMGSLSES